MNGSKMEQCILHFMFRPSLFSVPVVKSSPQYLPKYVTGELVVNSILLGCFSTSVESVRQGERQPGTCAENILSSSASPLSTVVHPPSPPGDEQNIEGHRSYLTVTPKMFQNNIRLAILVLSRVFCVAAGASVQTLLLQAALTGSDGGGHLAGGHGDLRLDSDLILDPQSSFTPHSRSDALRWIHGGTGRRERHLLTSGGRLFFPEGRGVFIMD